MQEVDENLQKEDATEDLKIEDGKSHERKEITDHVEWLKELAKNSPCCDEDRSQVCIHFSMIFVALNLRAETNLSVLSSGISLGLCLSVSADCAALVRLLGKNPPASS